MKWLYLLLFLGAIGMGIYWWKSQKKSEEIAKPAFQPGVSDEGVVESPQTQGSPLDFVSPAVPAPSSPTTTGQTTPALPPYSPDVNPPNYSEPPPPPQRWSPEEDGYSAEPYVEPVPSEEEFAPPPPPPPPDEDYD